MFTNQEVYAATGIQVSDVQAIAAKFNYLAPYSQKCVESMKDVRDAAKQEKQTIKKFLATIEVGEPVQPAPNQQASAIDQDITTQQFQASLAAATQGLTTTAIDLYATLDEHLTTHEEAFADAVLNRVNASPVNCMTLVAQKLGVNAPRFFQIAPEGAVLSSFAVPAKRIFGSGGEGSASTQTALKSAVFADASIVQ
jgi:lysozyme family protein